MSARTTVLFTGYAPVHFLCFAPLYARLVDDPSVDVRVSAGLRSFADDGSVSYDEQGLYLPLGVDPAHIVPTDALDQMDVDVLFSAHTNLIAPRSVGRTVQIFHGISFRNRGLRPANMSCDHYFVVGPYMERRLVQTGLMEPDDPRIVRTGFMKTDPLIDGSLDRRDVLDAHGMTGERPVVVYAPTGADRNSLQSIGEDVLRALDAADRFDVLVKLHDHPKDDVDWAARIAALEGPHLRLVRGLDVIPILHAADLLISDASSVSNEFSLTHRPQVFLDVPDLIRKSSAAKFQTIDLDTWGRRAGPVVASPDEIVDAVAGELADPDRLRDVREAMARDLFYHPGSATQAAHAWVRETVVGTVEQPAAS